MSWLTDYRRDVARYTAYSGGSRMVQILTQQGLWALCQYRLAHALHRGPLPFWIKRPLLLLAVAGQKGIEILTGISLPYTARLGAGLYLGHFGPIVINGKAVVGTGCNLSQGVTLGVSGRGEARGVPVLGDRVYVGAQATIAGKIRIGDDAVVAANSLVTRDVAPGVTVLGVPARVVAERDSSEYLDPGGEERG